MEILFHLLMGNCFTYLWKLFQNFLVRTLTKVFSDANLFSNLVTIDLLSELYLMVPLLLLVTNSNRLIRYWITATGAGAGVWWEGLPVTCSGKHVHGTMAAFRGAMEHQERPTAPLTV